MVTEFDVLQRRLGDALAANRPNSGTEHVLFVMPSHSVGESLLSHYADRVHALEHRYLVAALLLGRIRSCEMVILVSKAPAPEIIDYYISFLPEDARVSARQRLRVEEIPGDNHRSMSDKLLDRPDLVSDLRDLVRGRPAFIEPWNVTDAEVDVACRLGVPLNGTSPALRGRAFKSAGRRLCEAAGVPVPLGREDLRSVDDIVRAVGELRAARPSLQRVLIKLDDSGSGDGNMALDLTGPDSSEAGLRRRVGAMPSWYLGDLANGAVLEEYVSGSWFSSPSAQVDIGPGGDVSILSTHEQVLGGESGQVYLGCRFPASPRYATEIADHARSIGRQLAKAGAIGRCGVDFVVAGTADGGHTVAAVDINLRKGGTTHPFTVLRNLVPGSYDAQRARWTRATDGSERSYVATDNAVDPAWKGLRPAEVIAQVRAEGLEFDGAAGVGVVLHMLTGLAIDGRFGMTAVGRSTQEADDLHQAALATVHRMGSTPASGR
ncbi:MAG TPA: peptide ligase PGM1-related protein [Acidimicrobiales bacterium]|nr:peptide ligase PGM1-related protein [Acidimicrobiales bacterium]